jgi:hypothetical protein
MWSGTLVSRSTFSRRSSDQKQVLSFNYRPSHRSLLTYCTSAELAGADPLTNGIFRYVCKKKQKKQSNHAYTSPVWQWRLPRRYRNSWHLEALLEGSRPFMFYPISERALGAPVAYSRRSPRFHHEPPCKNNCTYTDFACRSLLILGSLGWVMQVNLKNKGDRR